MAREADRARGAHGGPVASGLGSQAAGPQRLYRRLEWRRAHAGYCLPPAPVLSRRAPAFAVVSGPACNRDPDTTIEATQVHSDAGYGNFKLPLLYIAMLLP